MTRNYQAPVPVLVDAGMLMPSASGQAPGIGHNQPPDPAAKVRGRVEGLIAAGNAWKQVKDIADADEAAKLEDAYQQARRAFSDSGWLEEERKAVNKPLRDEIAANDDAFKPLRLAGVAFLDILVRLRTAWLRKEDERIQREALEAARKAEEARKAAEAAAKSAETIEDIVVAEEATEAAAHAAAAADAAMRAKPQIKGEYSARAGSFRTYYSAEITDLAAATAFYLANPLSAVMIKDAVQQIADAHARRVKDALNVPGIKLKTERKAV